ncbi:hypothetical protein OBBRIDRAFT_886071 [Obba rivulosa]|uniref:Uncharacterized protein n=1 Tax=Obba rivulosa TaxID=1052685 RepID=A0A8E2DMW1_9APHY|nr:hypothetical protein OBBRIDRAFT_886071 [Obba rivulosa]
MRPKDGRHSIFMRMGQGILNAILFLWRRPSPPQQITLRSIIPKKLDQPAPIVGDPYLTYDIFVYLMFFLDKAELLSVMQTCRGLQTGGVSCLLQRAPILTSDKHMRSFFSFMLVDRPYRFPMLQTCNLGLRCTLSDSAFSLMIQTLARCNNITTLHLTIFDEVLEENPNVAMAIASLPCVKCCWIHAHARVYTVAEFIGWMPSPIESLAFESHQGLAYPDMLLQNFKMTLESLIVSFADFTELKAEYPHLQHLEFIDEAAVKLDTATLARTFPALSTWEFPFHPPKHDGFPEYTRWLNQAGFKKDGCWDHLDNISGHIRHIYRTGVTCRVDQLICHMDVSDANELQVILHDLRPRRLQLRIELEVFPLDLPRNLLAEASNMTDLRLTIVFDSFQDVPQAEIIEDLYDILATLRLTYLSVMLKWQDIEMHLHSSHPTLLALKKLGDLDFVARASSAIPTLRSIAFSVSGISVSEWSIQKSPHGNRIPRLDRMQWLS